MEENNSLNSINDFMDNKINKEEVDPELLQDFVVDVKEIIENIESDVLSLGFEPNDMDIIDSLFRSFHTIKGHAGFVYQNLIQNIAHFTENLLSACKKGKISVNPKIVDLILKSSDYIKKICEDINLNNDKNFVNTVEEHLKLFSNLDGFTIKESEKESEIPISNSPEEEKSEEDFLKDIESILVSSDMIDKFIQETEDLIQDIEQDLLDWLETPDNMEIVARLFRYFHSIKGNCGIFGYSDLEKLTHRIETVLEVVKTEAKVDKIKIINILLRLIDTLNESISDISRGGKGVIENLDLHLELLDSLLPKGWRSVDEVNQVPRLGDILIKEGLISNDVVDSVLEDQRKTFGEILVDKGIVTSEQVDKALKVQEEAKKHLIRTKEETNISNGAIKQTIRKQENLRVDLEKLDTLINLIGELVIAENMLIHNPDLEGLELENFNKAAQHLNKIVRELQEISMVIRMIPVNALFRRMSRLVHDLSIKFNKRVKLEISGESTELDKTVIELITDPMVHLIRNALDHGLETTEERIRKGKPEEGTIKISAYHEEGEVWIIVEDDGRGLNKEKILSKAKSMGLIEGDVSQLKDKDIFNLILLPGFSTSDKVTDISGRGVGMDVVKQNIEKIKGKIEIQSKTGYGTKIILRIPLTLAIIDGMMVKVENSKFIIPILSIRESFKPNLRLINILPDGTEIVRLRESFLPVLRLHKLLKKSSNHKNLEDGILIIVQSQNQRMALLVDEILGQQQIVIKGLSEYIGNVKGLSGCTILGNGEVCLILDVSGLIDISERLFTSIENNVKEKNTCSNYR